MRSLILIFLTLNVYAQNKKLDTVFCDCDKARSITLNGNTKIGPTIPPMGPGQKNEISHVKNNSQYVFEKEHHSAWYKLNMNTKGTFVFDIYPNQTNDDYDFVLFKAGKSNFCDSLTNFKVRPLRSCISRDRQGIKSSTGLSNLTDEEFIHEGIGDQYSASVKVEKGEVYYLVLDNVYEKGDGHIIQFYFEELIPFLGQVLDEDGNGVQTDITLVNQKGDTVLAKTTEPDGSYNINLLLRRNIDYTMNFFNERSFSYSRNISLKDTVELKHLSTILPKLKKGSKHSVGSINFIGGETMYLQRSIPSIMNLYKLLYKNPSLRIKIIGHSNGRFMKNEKEIMKFTLDRAITIRDFLIAKGIHLSRIEVEGKGDHEMLFKPPSGISEKQAEMNRRVEIMVLEY